MFQLGTSSFQIDTTSDIFHVSMLGYRKRQPYTFKVAGSYHEGQISRLHFSSLELLFDNVDA